MTQLHKSMLEDELQRRNYSKTTTRTYVSVVRDFARHFKRAPDQLGLDEIRQCQVHLLEDRKFQPTTACLYTSALRFFFVKVLKRPYPVEELPYPEGTWRLPIILSQEAVALVNSASNLMHRAMLRTLYSAGLRRNELCQLKVEDIDSKRMMFTSAKAKSLKTAMFR